jgi:hypothetical protein
MIVASVNRIAAFTMMEEEMIIIISNLYIHNEANNILTASAHFLLVQSFYFDCHLSTLN